MHLTLGLCNGQTRVQIYRKSLLFCIALIFSSYQKAFTKTVNWKMSNYGQCCDFESLSWQLNLHSPSVWFLSARSYQTKFLCKNEVLAEISLLRYVRKPPKMSSFIYPYPNEVCNAQNHGNCFKSFNRFLVTK